MRIKRTFEITSQQEMTAFASKLATVLAPGSAVLLSGPIGAGKTHLARGIIQALLPSHEDIPSPTYTLVQSYDTGDFEIWHADLYRLADSSELVELGLDEAFDTSIVIIEWPDRLPADMVPTTAISIEIRLKGEIRSLVVSAPEKAIADVLMALEHA